MLVSLEASTEVELLIRIVSRLQHLCKEGQQQDWQRKNLNFNESLYQPGVNVYSEFCPSDLVLVNLRWLFLHTPALLSHQM